MNKLLIGGMAIVVLLVAGFFLFTNQTKKETITPSVTKESPTPTSSPSAQLEERKVDVTKAGFEPKELRIKVGTRVIWENKSGGVANVSSTPHPIHSDFPFLNLGDFEDGSSVEVVFEKAGTYTYHNHLNSSQTGTVIVE